MAKFCSRCGKKLEDGQVCTCAPVTKEVNVNNLFTKALEVFKGMFTKPVETMKSFTDDSNFVLAFILIGVNSLAMAFMSLIFMKSLFGLFFGGFASLLGAMEIPYVKIFFEVLIATYAVNMLVVVAIFLFGKVFKINISFKAATNLVAVNTIISSCGYILALLCGLFSTTIAIFVITVCGFIGMFNIYGGVREMAKGKEEFVTWMLTSAYASVLVITSLLSKVIK